MCRTWENYRCGNLRQLQKFTFQLGNFDYYSEARVLWTRCKDVLGFRAKKVYNQSSWRGHHTSCTRKPAPVP